MLASTLVLGLLALAPATLAAPRVNKRANYGGDINDIKVLQFAATLEALEYSYYAAGLEKFSADDLVAAGMGEVLSSMVFKQLGVLRDDEETHLNALDAALEAAGYDLFWKTCQLDFSSVLGDIKTFAAAARAFEQVGVGAYIGASPLLSASTLITAEEIATVEARHSSFLNILNGGSYVGSAFDIALAPQAVGALVSPYLVKGEGLCPLAAELGIHAHIPLTAVVSGKQLSFNIRGQPQIEGYCQLLQGGMTEAVVMGTEQCTIPDTFTDGPVFVWVTGTDVPLAADPNVQVQSTVVAGPAVFFVDPSTPTGFSIV